MRVFCVAGCNVIGTPLVGRLPESRCRSALGDVLTMGKLVETWMAAVARACSRRAKEIFKVWFADKACASSVLRSSSWKTVHHSPLGMASLGAPSRQGSASSQPATVGAGGLL